MTERKLDLSSVCTANSARSSLAEAMLNQLDADCFYPSSVASHSRHMVHPLAYATLGQPH